MAQTPPRQVEVTLLAHAGLAVAFVRLVSALVRLGWRPTEQTADRLAAFAGKLIWVRAVHETGSSNGWITRRAGRMSVRRAT